MFPDSRDSEEGVKKESPKKAGKKNLLPYVGIAVVLLLTLTAIVLAISLSKVQRITVPEGIAQKFEPTIYLPSKLPGQYKIDQSTFALAEGDSVLIFNAKDGVNGDLIFSEQAKPKDFDFDKFHKGNFENPQTLSDVHYPSVWGETADGRSALSIVADDTWILVTTSAPLNQNDMVRIASGIKR